MKKRRANRGKHEGDRGTCIRTSRATHGAIVQLAAALTTERQTRQTQEDALAFAVGLAMRTIKEGATK